MRLPDRGTRIALIACAGTLLLAQPALAQVSPGSGTEAGMAHGSQAWFAVLELPFILLAILFSFRTAGAMRGGRLGRGMGLLAWGFVVMGIGHLLLMTQQIWGVDLLGKYFGAAGTALWVAALVATWVLSWLGFYSMYQVSKGPTAETR